MSKHHLEYFTLHTCVSMFAVLLVAMGILANVIQLDFTSSQDVASINTTSR
jgi:hypothetical protein